MSPVSFGFPAMGAEAPSAYHVDPIWTTENSTQAAGYPAAPAAGLPEAVRVGVDGTAGKKKRGRPRKYGPGGTVPMAPLAAVPVSSYPPATGIFASGWGGSGGLEDIQRMKAPKLSPDDFCMQGGLSPELFGFPVIGAEAPSAYNVAPSTENPTQAAGYPAAPAAGLPDAVRVGVDAGKRKPGRPRKYGPDGTVPKAPLPAYAPATVIFASSSRKTRRGGSGSLEDKHRMKPPREVPRVSSYIGQEKWSVIVTPCVNYKTHRRIIRPREDVASLLVRTRIQNKAVDLCVVSASGVLSKVTLRKRDSPTGMITHQGRFKIHKLNGGLVRNPGQGNTVGGITISAEDKTDGRVIGGTVVGYLLAATPVEVVYATFRQGEPYGIPKDSTPEAAPNAEAPATNIAPAAAPAANIPPPATAATNIPPPAALATTNIAPVAAPAATNMAPPAAPATINLAPPAAPATTNMAPPAAPATNIAPAAAPATNIAPAAAPGNNIPPGAADVSNAENGGQGDQNPGAPNPNLGSSFPFPGENDATKDPMQDSPDLAIDVHLAWLRNYFRVN